MAKYKNKYAGSFGDFGCFSLHPLKNLNVWGDGGFVVIKKKKYFNKMMLLRNHGLEGRNKNLLFGYNSRLDTLQACVANHLIKKIRFITKMRIKNANKFDEGLKDINNIIVKNRSLDIKEVYHLYEFRVRKKKYRDKLVKHLIKNKIDAKIHYPIPMHLQPAAKNYKYKKGDFPKTEEIAKSTISLPVHEFVKQKQIEKITKIIKKFFLMKINFTDFKKEFVYLEKDLIKSFRQIGKKGSYIMGKELEIFEKNVKKYLGAKYVLGVGNWTEGMTMVCKALNFRENDEIITVSNSFIATCGAISYAGCKPVLIDVDQTLNMDTHILEKKLQKGQEL